MARVRPSPLPPHFQPHPVQHQMVPNQRAPQQRSDGLRAVAHIDPQVAPVRRHILKAPQVLELGQEVVARPRHAPLLAPLHQELQHGERLPRRERRGWVGLGWWRRWWCEVCLWGWGPDAAARPRAFSAQSLNE